MATILDSFINLRNDLKTWITNNLRLKANKSDLTASDGTEFKFKYIDGKYGFYNDDDEFISFDNVEELSGNKARLVDYVYDAIQTGNGTQSKSVKYIPPNPDKKYLVIASAVKGDINNAYQSMSLSMTVDGVVIRVSGYRYRPVTSTGFI